MQSRRGATRRDLPAILLFYGVFVWSFAILFACSDIGRLAVGSPLQTISGTVESVFHEYGRSGNYFNLIVQTSAGPRHLTEEDLLMRSVPEASRFAPGDTVTAEVRNQSLHDVDWCWALTRNGRVILTLDQTERYFQTTVQEHRRFSDKFDLWALIGSSSLITCAVVLRRHFGGWLDKDRSASNAHS
jgi:hypothetical protein